MNHFPHDVSRCFAVFSKYQAGVLDGSFGVRSWEEEEGGKGRKESRNEIQPAGEMKGSLAETVFWGRRRLRQGAGRSQGTLRTWHL